MSAVRKAYRTKLEKLLPVLKGSDLTDVTLVAAKYDNFSLPRPDLIRNSRKVIIVCEDLAWQSLWSTLA
jgi:hypothetical protein